MNKKLYLIIISISISLFSAKAQDPVFSQYYANGAYINPALTAIESQTKIGLQYRNQWAGNATKYSTYNLAFETPIKNTSSAIGILALHDETANQALNHTQVGFIYNYQFQITKQWVIKAALQAGFGQNNLNANELVFEDQLNLEGPNTLHSAEYTGHEQKLYPDFSSGFAILSKQFYFGFAAHHLTEPNIAFIKDNNNTLSRKYTFHGGAKISKKEHGKVNSYYSPNIIIQNQGESNTWSIGNYFKHNALTAGLWYRWNEALIASIGLEYENLRIAYSTDFNVGQYPGSQLSHEISLNILLPQKNKERNLYNSELVFCPTF